MPPSVIKTVPQAGDTNVDPSLKEISVTFSKDMKTNNQWSWLHYTLETFPQIDKNNIRYLDKRTCVLPVKLKPEKTYVIRINTQQYNYFKDKNGKSAIPYLLVFQTRKWEVTARHDAAGRTRGQWKLRVWTRIYRITGLPGLPHPIHCHLLSLQCPMFSQLPIFLCALCVLCG